jgi:GntR family transcriptional repressor for pyruvate dehydrogenase complex
MAIESNRSSLARNPAGTAARPGATAEVIEVVCERIRDGRYRPGDRLPSERDLAEDLSVSRPTMREAIQSLATLNIVEVRRGSGVYVAALDAEVLLRPVLFALDLTRPTAKSLFEVRLALEPLAASLAAQNADESQLAAMRECLAQAERGKPSKRRMLELDTRLHRLVVESARNDLLLGLVASLGVLSQRSRERTVKEPGVIERSLIDHRSIVRAIELGDPDRAERAMRRHLERLERLYLSFDK